MDPRAGFKGSSSRVFPRWCEKIRKMPLESWWARSGRADTYSAVPSFCIAPSCAELCAVSMWVGRSNPCHPEGHYDTSQTFTVDRHRIISKTLPGTEVDRGRTMCIC